jgi:glutaredoxin-like protein
VAPLSDKPTLEVKNFISDNEDVQKYNVDKIPAICLVGQKDHGIRMYGIPSGYEFLTFLETLLRISSRDSGLNDKSRNLLKQIKKSVHIQVFVTPTCPYCPRAAVTGLQLAQESDFVSRDVVEISEFPHPAQKYGVMGVPKVVFNANHGFEGAIPEQLFVEHVIHAGQ